MRRNKGLQQGQLWRLSRIRFRPSFRGLASSNLQGLGAQPNDCRSFEFVQLTLPIGNRVGLNPFKSPRREEQPSLHPFQGEQWMKFECEDIFLAIVGVQVLSRQQR